MFNDGSTGWPSWEDVKNFVKQINEQLPHKDICFRISGGEPTYWKHFLDFAELVNSYGNSFTFLSNGSRDITYFSDIGKLSTGILLSYHTEYANPQQFVDIANAANCPVAVNLMMMPVQFDKLVEVAKFLYDNSKVAVWPKMILDKINMTNQVASYTEEQKEFIKQWPYFRQLDDEKMHRGILLLDDTPITANELVLQGLNKHKGWTCWAGLDMLNIDYVGNVFSADCGQRPLGTIQNFMLPTSTLICGKDLCSCLSDIYLRKENE
jgi:organic radical activating enzyme